MLFCATCIKDITGYYRISNEIVFFSRGTDGESTKAEGLSILIADGSKFLVLLKHKQHHMGGQKSYSITRNHSTILVTEGFSSFSQLSCSPNNMPKWTPSSSLTPTRMYIHL